MDKKKIYTKFGTRFEYQEKDLLENNYPYVIDALGPTFIEKVEYIINMPVFIIKEVIYKIKKKERKEKKGNRPYERYIAKAEKKEIVNEKSDDEPDNSICEDAEEYHESYLAYLREIKLKYGQDVEDVIETKQGYYLFYETKPHFIQRYNENTTKIVHIGEEKDDKTTCECFYKRKGYFLTYGDFVVLDLNKKKNTWKIMMLPSKKIKYISMKKMIKIYCRVKRIKAKDIRYLATDREKAIDDGTKGEFFKW